MPISGGDVTKLQSSRHSVELILNAVPLVTVASALINQASFAYPIAQITVDNTSGWSAVETGQAFRIKDLTGKVVTWGCVRKAPTATVLYIDAKSLGDSGVPEQILGGLADNYPIEIFKHRPPWAMFSRIYNKVFYKLFDLAAGTNLTSPAPIAILGGHVQGYVDTGTGLFRHTFDSSGSLPWPPKTIASQVWTIDGATLASGALTDASITVDFEPGFYCITCTVTDSAGKTHQGYRYVWANETSGPNAPLGRRRVWDWSGDREDRTGREAQLALYGDLDADEVFPGQMFHFYEAAYFNGEPLADETQRVSTFVGYAAAWSMERARFVPKTTITLEGPGLYARRVAAVSQQFSEAASPSGWNKVPSSLSNPMGALWYTLYWHAPNLLAGHDVSCDSSIRALRKQSFVFQAKTIGEQIAQIQSLTLGGLGTLSDGTWVLLPSAQYMNTSDRNGLDEKFEWQAGDVQAPFAYDQTIVMPTGQVKGYAFGYSGGKLPRAYSSIAPGYASAQSSGQESITFIVTPSTKAAETLRVYEITGHHFALLNNPQAKISLDADRNIDIAEPMVTNVWHRLTIAAQWDPQGVGLSTRALPFQINREYKRTETSVTKKVTIQWELEAFGQPGVYLPIDRGGAANWVINGQNIQIPVLYTQTPTSGLYNPSLPSGTIVYCDLNNEQYARVQRVGVRLPSAPKILIAPNTDGYLYRTFNADDDSPDWTRAALTGVTGTILQYKPNPLDPTKGWLVTSTMIVYLEDVFCDPPTITVQHTFATATLYRSLAVASSGSSVGQSAVVSSYYDPTGGVTSTYTTDEGASWTEITVDSVVGNVGAFAGYEASNPGCYFNPYDNYYYTTTYGSELYTSPADEGQTQLWKSADGSSWADAWGDSSTGLSWRALSSEIAYWPDSNRDFGSGQYNDLMMQTFSWTGSPPPYLNELRMVVGSADVFSIYSYDSFNLSAFDPAYSGTADSTYGPCNRRSGDQLDFPVGAGNMVAMCGETANHSYSGVFVITKLERKATGGGAACYTFEVVAFHTSSPNYRRCQFAVDDDHYLWMWGEGGMIARAYMPSLTGDGTAPSNNYSISGLEIVDLGGNIPTDFPSAGEFLYVSGA